MGKILCATRGGEESIQTQKFAIEHAKANGDDLVFIYIFDLDFLLKATHKGRTEVLNDEMVNMAEFLMTMAVERAHEAGYDASFKVCKGKFAPTLAERAAEEEATLVILGRPTKGGNFQIAAIESLAEKMTEETGIKFMVRPAEETT